VDDHSSATDVTIRLKRPTRIRRRSRHEDPYLVLLRVGFTIATPVASRAVRSYRTFSPLPKQTLGRFPFCCTFRRLAPPRCYLALWSQEPGLSSAGWTGSDRL